MKFQEKANKMTKELTLEMLDIPKSINMMSKVTYAASMLKGKNIDFDVTLDSGINLQRGFVWTLAQKQEFIMSMIKGIDIPSIYLYIYTDAEDKDTFKIIDGKQRISTLLDFYNNKFPIYVNGVAYNFKNLHNWLKSRVVSRPINSVVFYGYHDNKLSDNDLIEIFNYVNFTGTPQDVEHLNNLLKHKTNGK